MKQKKYYLWAVLIVVAVFITIFTVTRLVKNHNIKKQPTYYEFADEVHYKDTKDLVYMYHTEKDGTVKVHLKKTDFKFKKGEIYVFYDEEGSPVASIKFSKVVDKKGDEMIIKGTAPEIGDLVDRLVVNRGVDVPLEGFGPAKNVTIKDGHYNSISQDKHWLPMSEVVAADVAAEEEWIELEMATDAYGIPGNMNVKLYEPKVFFDVDIDFGSGNVNALNYSVEGNSSVSTNFDLVDSEELSKDIEVGSAVAYLGCGFVTKLKIYVHLETSASAEIEASVRYKVSYDHFAEQKFQTEIDPQIEKASGYIDGYVGLKPTLSLSFLVAKIVEIDVCCGPKGEVELSYYRTDPKICADGKIYILAYIEVPKEGALKYIDYDEDALYWELLNEENATIMHGHIENGKVIKNGKCAHEGEEKIDPKDRSKKLIPEGCVAVPQDGTRANHIVAVTENENGDYIASIESLSLSNQCVTVSMEDYKTFKLGCTYNFGEPWDYHCVDDSDGYYFCEEGLDSVGADGSCKDFWISDKHKNEDGTINVYYYVANAMKSFAPYYRYNYYAEAQVVISKDATIAYLKNNGKYTTIKFKDFYQLERSADPYMYGVDRGWQYTQNFELSGDEDGYVTYLKECYEAG